MTEVTTLVLSLLFCLVGVGLGFMFGWFTNEYYSAFMEAKVSQNTNIHPEMLNDQGFMIEEELLSVRFIDEEDYEED
jgi:hypothetical protein